MVGEADGDMLGWAVALSSDGNLVALGAGQGIALEPGYVRVFDLEDSSCL
jgi:hypothetical protein